MKQYIDKSALVAEIKRLSQKAIELYGYSQFNTAYNNVLSILDTREVKEVDLGKEIDNYLDKNFYISETWGIFSEKTENEINRSDLEDIAKHFFELGMHAKEGNTLAKAKGFLVRDKDDYTAIYSTKPNRGKTEWVDGNHPRNANESSCLFTMDARLLPNLEFGDEPLEVEVTITKKGE